MCGFHLLILRLQFGAFSAFEADSVYFMFSIQSKQKMSENEQKPKLAELTQKVKTLETFKVAAEKELKEAKQLNSQMTQYREVLSREKVIYAP